MSVTFSELTTMLASRNALPPIQKTANADIALGAEESSLIASLARWQRKAWPQVTRPRLAAYVGACDDAASMQKTLDQLAKGEHALTRLVAMCNSDMRVFEMDITAKRTALSETAAAHAISYGLMSLEETTDVLLLTSLDNTLVAPLYAQVKNAKAEEIMMLFAKTGAVELCALLGAALAARMALTPVIADHVLASLLHCAVSTLCGGEETPVCASLPFTHAHPATLQSALTLHHLQALLALGASAKKLTTLSAAA